jgi:Zn-finger nucleic acid-binding protein
MKCPHDNADLVMADRQGIEIDYCPTCRGVWLDRGELDKIIERSAAAQPAAAPAPQRSDPQQARAFDQRREHDRGYGERGEYGEGGEYGEHGERGSGYGSGYGRRRKRESFLGELFDF